CASCGGSGSSGSSTKASASSASASAPPAASTPSPSPPSNSTPSSQTATSPTSPTTSTPPKSQSSAPPTYKIVEIPTLTPTSSAPNLISCSAAAVNDRGVVAGLCAFGCNCRDPEPAGFERAWMYDENSSALTELTFEPSELGAIATDISDSGIITGEEYDAKDDPYPGYWTVTGGAMLLMGQ